MQLLGVHCERCRVESCSVASVSGACEDELRQIDRSMIIAMVAVRMMQMPVHQIIDVVAMGDRLMPTPRSMHMPGLVSGAAVLRRAAIGVLGRHFNHVLVDMVPVRMVQVPVMEKVDMVAMPDGGMTAAGAVLMRMVRMMWLVARWHGSPPADFV